MQLRPKDPLVTPTKWILLSIYFFFFNHTATTELYTLSLHDALPISRLSGLSRLVSALPSACAGGFWREQQPAQRPEDRKSTRLNSSHTVISYAVFCLKKKIDDIGDRPDFLRFQVSWGG